MIQGNYETKLKARSVAIRKRLMSPANSVASIAEAKRHSYIDMYKSFPSSITAAILQEVGSEHEVSVDDMTSAKRFKNIVAARDHAIQRLRNERNLSLFQIGIVFNRDHTSILRSLQKAGGMNKLTSS